MANGYHGDEHTAGGVVHEKWATPPLRYARQKGTGARLCRISGMAEGGYGGMISIADGCTAADATIAAAYRRQAAECRAGMHAALACGWDQAAALLAVQAVRSAANGLLAAHAGVAATGRDADPIDQLFRRLTGTSTDRPLAAGAEVLAYEEDLRAYGFALEPPEARQLLTLAELFCLWAAR